MWNEEEQLKIRALHMINHSDRPKYRTEEGLKEVLDAVYAASGVFEELPAPLQREILTIESDPEIYPGWESEYPAPTGYYEALRNEIAGEEAEGIAPRGSE